MNKILFYYPIYTKYYTDSYFAGVEIARALSKAGVPLVPQIMAGGNGGGSGSTLVEVLLANVIRDQLAKTTPDKPAVLAKAEEPTGPAPAPAV